MTEEWVLSLMDWAAKVDALGAEHGLNPALREFFAEHVAAGAGPEDAACRACAACEIVEPMPVDKMRAALASDLNSARCTHLFTSSERIRSHGGLRGKCTMCRCTFTSWPGGMHYDELERVEAKH